MTMLLQLLIIDCSLVSGIDCDAFSAKDVNAD